MPSNWTEWGALTGVVLGMANLLWMLCNSWWARPKLHVEVEWDGRGRWDGEDAPSPRVTVRNTGGATHFIDKISVVEANGDINVIAVFDNQEVKSGQSFSHKPDWNDEDHPREVFEDDFPQFRHGWKGMRIVVTDGQGKAWRSRAAPGQPPWFELAKPRTNDLDWLSQSQVGLASQGTSAST